MYCMRCGKQFNEDVGVCPQCGAVAGSAGGTSPKKTHGPLIAGICATVVLVIAIVVGCLVFARYLQDKKSSQLVAKYQKIYDKVDNRFDNYIMEKVDKGQLENYKEELGSAIQDRDENKCEKITGCLDELEKTVKEATIRTVSELKAKIDGEGTGGLLNAEIEDYNTAKVQAEQLYAANKYLEANKQYNICQGILDNASGASDYSMDLRQVDVTNFPDIKLYLSILNKATNESVEALAADKFLLREKVGNGKDYKELTIDSIKQMNKNFGLNTAMVADVSASMGSDMSIAEDAMTDFIQSLQFDVKDRAALYSFSDYVYREQHFTSNEAKLKKAINGLKMGNMTALYDALVYAISDIVVEDGAKCVIAFTDGAENSSNSTKDYVIQKAKKYDIPIYIIGIGNSVDSYALQDIADQTGGWYRNITNVNSMSDVYNEIYADQKSMYVLKYTTQKENKEKLARDVYIRYADNTLMASTESVYTPSDYKIDGYIFYDSDSRYLQKSELKNLSEEEVLIALNELYARRGYQFQTNQFLIDHFNNCDWYQGKDTNQAVVEKRFNKYERKNKNMLVTYEKEHKLNNRK